MTQKWYGLNTYNVTELKNDSNYNMGSSKSIVFWNNMSKNFICRTQFPRYRPRPP